MSTVTYHTTYSHTRYSMNTYTPSCTVVPCMLPGAVLLVARVEAVFIGTTLAVGRRAGGARRCVVRVLVANSRRHASDGLHGR